MLFGEMGKYLKASLENITKKNRYGRDLKLIPVLYDPHLKGPSSPQVMSLTLWYLVRENYYAAPLEHLECDFRVSFKTLPLLFIGKVTNTIYQPRGQSLSLLRVVVICLEVLRTDMKPRSRCGRTSAT